MGVAASCGGVSKHNTTFRIDSLCGAKGAPPVVEEGRGKSKSKITEAARSAELRGCVKIQHHFSHRIIMRIDLLCASIYYAPYGAGRSMLRPYEPHHSVEKG